MFLEGRPLAGFDQDAGVGVEGTGGIMVFREEDSTGLGTSLGKLVLRGLRQKPTGAIPL